MKNIKVALLHHTPLYIASDGARTCWSSQDKSDTCRHTNFHAAATEMCSSECLDCGTEQLNTVVIGPKDLALIDRVGNQYHHASILEHVSFNFFIDGISRACLQELCRHRMASLSVKSTRYTLKELKSEEAFTAYTDMDDQEYCLNGYERAAKYIVLTPDPKVNRMSILALDNLRDLLNEGISNDLCKYALPESYRTQLTWTINIRSLQNFLSLRTAPAALPEIQLLAKLIFEALPPQTQSIVQHCVYKKA